MKTKPKNKKKDKKRHWTDWMEELILPYHPVVADGDFIRERRLQEAEYRAEIDHDFESIPKMYLPLLPHDVHGTDTLRDIGRLLMRQIERV